MIDLETIKNTENHPYIFGIQGKYLTQAVMLFLAIGTISLLVILFLAVEKLWLISFFVLILELIALCAVLHYYQFISKITPFKGIEKIADIISHINFNKTFKNDY